MFFSTFRKALLMVFMMVISTVVFAQKAGISGVVLDESGELILRLKLKDFAL